MRLILWISTFVGTLIAGTVAYRQIRQSRLIAHPAYLDQIEVYPQQRLDGNPPSLEGIPSGSGLSSAVEEEECAVLQNIDWSGIRNNHTWLNGNQKREEVEADTIWTLRLSLLGFLGMEYDVFEIERLTAQELSYRRTEYGQSTDSIPKLETHAFGFFQEKACGLHRVHPMLYVASDLGQVALTVQPDFLADFMNRADFRVRLGERLNKHYRIDINRDSWTLEELLQLAEQP